MTWAIQTNGCKCSPFVFLQVSESAAKTSLQRLLLRRSGQPAQWAVRAASKGARDVQGAHPGEIPRRLGGLGQETLLLNPQDFFSWLTYGIDGRRFSISSWKRLKYFFAILIRDHDVFSHLENICCRIPKFYFLLFYRLLSLHLEFRTKGEKEFLTCLCDQLWLLNPKYYNGFFNSSGYIIMCHYDITLIMKSYNKLRAAVADPRYPRWGGDQYQRRGTNLLFWPFFFQNCINIKKN